MGNLKICNLEMVAPTLNRQLVVGDKTFEVKTMTVEDFIELNLLRQQIGEADMKEGLELMIKLVQYSVPGLPVEVVRNMSLAQLQIVIRFIFDELSDDELKGAVEHDGEKVAEDGSGN